MNSKILLIAQPYAGGAERMTLLYGKILERAGYDIELLMLKLKHRPQTTLKTFVPTNWPATMAEGRFRNFLVLLMKHIIVSKPDVVFSSCPAFSTMLLLLKKSHLVSAKIVIRDCNMPSTHTKRNILMARWLYKKANAIISQTNEMKAEMAEYYKLPKERVTVINNPLDKGLIAAGIKEKYIFDTTYVNYVGIGRIVKQKDFLTMVKAFKIVLDVNPKSRLYIIGEVKDWAVKDELDAYIKESGVQGNVMFEGFQDNPFKYLAGCDVFCLSSVYEGLPNVMLEAMYLGRPVAVTRSIPFISQMVKDGVNGYSCNIGDPQAFAKCMLMAREIRNLPMYADVVESEGLIINTFQNL